MTGRAGGAVSFAGGTGGRAPQLIGRRNRTREKNDTTASVMAVPSGNKAGVSQDSTIIHS